MSEASRRNACTSTVIDGGTTVSRVYSGASYLVGFSAPTTDGSTSIRFTDWVGGSPKWEHKIAAEAQAGTGSDVILFGWPIRCDTGIACSITDLEGSISVSYIPD